MSETKIQRSRKVETKKPIVTAPRIYGAAILAAAGIAFGKTEMFKSANSANGRAIPEHSVRIENADGIQGATMVVQEGNAPAEQVAVSSEASSDTAIQFNRATDQDVFGFIAKHLKGDPRNYLEELKKQLPPEDQANYNAPDGFIFEVPSDAVVQNEAPIDSVGNG